MRIRVLIAFFLFFIQPEGTSYAIGPHLACQDCIETGIPYILQSGE